MHSVQGFLSLAAPAPSLEAHLYIYLLGSSLKLHVICPYDTKMVLLAPVHDWNDGAS